MTNHANDAARYINERIAEPETEPTVTDLRAKFPRRPMVEKTPRPYLIDVRTREEDCA